MGKRIVLCTIAAHPRHKNKKVPWVGHPAPGDPATVSFTVKNTGKRAGTEIAQVYASLPDAAGEPPKRLVGWTRVELAPGEAKQVAVPVSRDRLTVYDEASDSWKLVPGNYVIRVGGSSQDLSLQQAVSF